MSTWYLNSNPLDFQAVSGLHYPVFSQAMWACALHLKNARMHSLEGMRNNWSYLIFAIPSSKPGRAQTPLLSAEITGGTAAQGPVALGGQVSVVLGLTPGWFLEFHFVLSKWLQEIRKTNRDADTELNWSCMSSHNFCSINSKMRECWFIIRSYIPYYMLENEKIGYFLSHIKVILFSLILNDV